MHFPKYLYLQYFYHRGYGLLCSRFCLLRVKALLQKRRVFPVLTWEGIQQLLHDMRGFFWVPVFRPVLILPGILSYFPYFFSFFSLVAVTLNTASAISSIARDAFSISFFAMIRRDSVVSLSSFLVFLEAE